MADEYMTKMEDILIKAIQEEIACQSAGMQAYIRECYQNLRTVYETWGQAGPMALALLGAEEQKKASDHQHGKTPLSDADDGKD